MRRSFANLDGGFIKRSRESGFYWYFRTSEGLAGQKEFYLGPDNEETRRLIEQVEARREAVAETGEGVSALSAMLRAGGAMVHDSTSSRIIRGLGAAGLFRLGGVLIGTHGYLAIGNAMGVRWSTALRTDDVDLAAVRTLDFGIPQTPQMMGNIPKALDALEMGFIPCVQIHSARKPTSYVAPSRDEWKIDFLTDPRGRDRSSPVLIPRLNIHAQPLEFMGYLLEKSFDALVLDKEPTLVRVPEPAWFALHKLLVASNRDPARQAKAAKDRQQAFELLSFLTAERPRDIDLAAESLRSRGSKWVARVVQEANKFPDEIPGLMERILGGRATPKSIP